MVINDEFQPPADMTGPEAANGFKIDYIDWLSLFPEYNYMFPGAYNGVFGRNRFGRDWV